MHIAVCQTSSHQKRALRHPDFEEFWQKHRKELHIKELPKFHFESQNNLSDADLVTGYIFYLLALKEKEQTKKYQVYLNTAINYGSFHALKNIVYDWILQPSDDKTKYCDILADHLLQLEDVIHQFKSPGYLLLATGYMTLAKAASGKDEAGRKSTAYSSVWKYLNLARLAEKDSTIEIHNAYFGQGLAFSNPWHFDTIDKILQEARDIISNFLSTPTQKFIANQATLEYKELSEIKKKPKLNQDL